MTFELRQLSENDGRDVYDMLQEIDRDENGFINTICGASYDEFHEWLVANAANARMTEIIDGWKVPQTIYWLYADGIPVGMAKLRHFLTDKLREEGGHIGYAVRPSARRKGCGIALLTAVLSEAAAKGIDRALVTVNVNNIPSQRLALHCGGVLEKKTDTRCYFWLDCPRTETAL